MTQNPENWYKNIGVPTYRFAINAIRKDGKIYDVIIKATDSYAAQEKFLKRRSISKFTAIHIEEIKTRTPIE